MTTHLVFVYGSLKRGFHNHRLMGDAPRLGDAVTTASYLMLDGGAFPYLIDPAQFSADHRDCLSDVVGTTKGEVYVIGNATLARLDKLEGHPDFYKRERVDVRLGDETAQLYRTCPAWVYFLADQDMLMDAGRWPPVVSPDEAGNVEWTQTRARGYVFDQIEEE